MRLETIAGVLATLAAACSSEPQPTARVVVSVAPLSLPGLSKVCYDLRVSNAPGGTGDVVWSRGNPASPEGQPDADSLCSTDYGSGADGAITFIGACDATPLDALGTPRVHSVTLWVDSLYDSHGALIARTGENGWQDPCPSGCTLEVPCTENSDTPVTFNLTILRQANQGFFDIGVNFADIFCSAKVDCVDGTGAPLKLLFHPVTGLRDTTVVAAFACTAGADATSTVLYRDALKIACDGVAVSLPPDAGQGNAWDTASPDPDLTDPVWQYAIYAKDENIQCGGVPCQKRFWNVAIGLDATADDCRLTTAMTASDGPFSNFSTPTGTTYPVISVDVPLTDTAGLTCGKHPLNGSNGVTTGYAPMSTPHKFDFDFDGVAFGQRETTWQEPLSWTSLPAAQINVSNDPWRAWVFADMMRGAEGWILKSEGAPLEPADGPTLAASFDVLADGMPRGLPADWGMEFHISYNTGEAVNASTGQSETRYLRGVYVLTWQGDGEVYLNPSINDGVGERHLLTTSNRRVMVLDTQSEYLIVRIRRSNPDDPIRDLRLWAPTHDGAGLELTNTSNLSVGNVEGSLEPAPGETAPFFHPAYLAHLAEAPRAGVLRFLGWQRINGVNDTTPVDWADRPSANLNMLSLEVIDRYWGRHAVPAFQGRLGAPFEWLIRLANETSRDLWVQVPHTATTALMDGLARLVAAQLRTDLRVWVEFSNELWNSAGPYLPQHNAAKARAASHFGISTEALSVTQIAWGAGQLQADFLKTFETAWRDEGRSDSSLLNVAAGFGAMPSYNAAMLASIAEVDPNLAEVFAGSHYFGLDSQGELFALHDFGTNPGQWPSALFDSAADVVRRLLQAERETWRQNAVVAANAGLPMVAYEGGQHIQPFGYGDRTIPAQDDFMNFMNAFQRSAQMGEIYAEQFAQWREAGGHTPSLFMDIGRWSFWGYWGAKEYLGQTRSESPRWEAFCHFTELELGVRSGHEPLGSRPDWTTRELRGEVGLLLDETLISSGGDGTRTVSLLGGRLPPGVALTDLGQGQAKFFGTPTSPGEYVAIIRVRDADGDVDDARISLAIDPAGYSDSVLVAFRGADLPYTPQGDGSPNGRFDPIRGEVVVPGVEGNATCVPFTLDSPLFGAEFLTTLTLPALSPLNIYGGWCLTPLSGATRAGAPQLSSWTGLRENRFKGWTGDLAGPSAFDAVLLWKRAQFAEPASAYTFTAGADTLQADLASVIGDGSNLLRFVVIDARAGVQRWFVSEAAWTRPQLGDGIFRLGGWVGSAAAGHRWAEVTAPTSTAMQIPQTGLTFQAESFEDIQAVGLWYRGTRWRWHYAFSFTRFFALGESLP